MSHQVKNLQRKSFLQSKKVHTRSTRIIRKSTKGQPLLISEEPTKLNELVKHICDQTNLYAAQKGSDFAINPKQIRAFLGINYIMSISKLPNVKCDDD